MIARPIAVACPVCPANSTATLNFGSTYFSTFSAISACCPGPTSASPSVRADDRCPGSLRPPAEFGGRDAELSVWVAFLNTLLPRESSISKVSFERRPRHDGAVQRQRAHVNSLARLIERLFGGEKDRNKTKFLLRASARRTSTHKDGSTCPMRSWHKGLSEYVVRLLNSDRYHDYLLRDYIGFISCLANLSKLVSVRWDDKAADFFLDGESSVQLRSIRLHDLVEKLAYEQLALHVTDELQLRSFAQFDDTSSAAKVAALHAAFQDTKIFVGSGMTRSTGIAEFKYIVDSSRNCPVTLGVQLRTKR